MAIIRFGTFEVRLTSAEIYKQGRRLRLQHQPFELLRTLLRQPGELVTRETLRKTLWPDGVTVDFDQNLNKCVTKLREALGDTATSPRFVETVPKRGYRFIAPVVTAPARDPAVSRPPLSAAQLWLPAAVALVVIAAAGLFIATGQQSTRVEARSARSAPATQSPIVAARDAYDRGHLALARRSQEGLRLSVVHFERALALSPRYAGAYVGLADSWSLLSSYGLLDPREGMPRAREAANRALSLDPTLARAHASLGRTTMVFDWDWRTARWHFTRAVALEPGHSTTHQWFAYMLSAIGSHPDAIDEARRGVAADPLSLNSNTALGYVLYLARRYDEAAAQLSRTLEIDPDFAPARRNLAFVHVQQGRFAEAVNGLQRVAALDDGSPVACAELAWAQAVAGDSASARAALARLDRLRGTTYVSPDSLALVYTGLGAIDEAIAWLQRASTLRTAALAHLPVEPVWDPLRQDARLRALTATIRTGLD